MGFIYGFVTCLVVFGVALFFVVKNNKKKTAALAEKLAAALEAKK